MRRRRLFLRARACAGGGATQQRARGSRGCPRAARPCRGGRVSERACVRALDGASALAGMDAGGDGGGGASGGAGEAFVASARSARHAVLLAIQALCVNEAAVREARAASDAIRAEIEWADNGCIGAIGCNAGAAVHATDSAAGGSDCGTEGLRSATAERLRKALLLVTQALGVSVVTVQEARVERDALKEELDLSLTDGKPPGGGAIVPEPLDVNVILRRAARDGAEYTLRHALLRGANVDALEFAINGGKIKCLRLLLEAGADMDKADCHGMTLLHMSTEGGRLDFLRVLLEAGAETDKTDEDGSVALHHAAWWGHVDCLRLLLEAGADKDKGDTTGLTPLHDAAECGHLDCLRLLLEAGADKNKCDTTGDTPLHKAAGAGHLDCLRLLLEAGAETNKADLDGRVPLHVAARLGLLDCLRLLLEAGADKNKGDTMGDTPLHLAAANLRLDCLQLLLEAGADIDKVNTVGDTPLHKAAGVGLLDCLWLLLEAGADASARNKEGYTPLDVAEANNNKEAAALLVYVTFCCS